MQRINNFYALYLQTKFLMMKGIIFGLFIFSMIFASCVKNSSTGGGCSFQPSNVAVPDSQVVATNDSIHAHGINNATPDPAGFFYHIDSSGSGATVTGLCSTVYVSYKASFFNGVTFDSTATGTVASFQLGQAIVGWQKALPLLSKGGVMTLYLPPSLAYGSSAVRDNSGNIIVPPNSYLVFNIKLADVQ